jgi:hypothetical protein
MVIKAAPIWVVYATHVADVVALIQDLRIAGPIDFISIDSIEKQEERTGGNLICVERAVVCT